MSKENLISKENLNIIKTIYEYYFCTDVVEWGLDSAYIRDISGNSVWVYPFNYIPYSALIQIMIANLKDQRATLYTGSEKKQYSKEYSNHIRQLQHILKGGI